MSKFLACFRSFAAHEEGAILVEYVLLVVLIALVCIVAVTFIGSAVRGFFTNIPSLV